MHNSRWTPSPGYATADDPARWPQLEAYVTDLVGSFGSDRRVLVWDLYNEPGGDRPKQSTQTYLHWYTRYSPEPGPEPRLWLHDVMRPDGELFDPAEAAVLREHAGQELALQPVPMTPQLMAHLEELGMIIRLRPGGHDLAAQPGETLGESIYETADRYARTS